MQRPEIVTISIGEIGNGMVSVSRFTAADVRRIDQPEVGCFAIRLTKGGPEVGARISCVSGEWSATINGVMQQPPAADPVQAGGVFRIWEWGRSIAPEEYDYLLALAAWASKHDPSHPLANPSQPIDLATAKPAF
jgi:hypothetical protein